MSTAIFPNLGSAQLDEGWMQNVEDYPPQFEMKISEIDDYIILHKSALVAMTATDKFMEYFSGHKSILGATPTTEKSMKYFSGTATARYYFYDDTQTKIQDEAKEVTGWYAVHSSQVSPLSSWKTGYLALTVGREHTYNSFIRYFQKHRILEEDSVIIPWDDNSVFSPLPSEAVSPTGNADLGHVYKDIILGKFSERFDVVAQREDNWDGLGSLKPNKISLDRADCIMMKLLDSVISNRYEWRDPYICSDEDGYITVEWTGGKRQLYLRIEEDEVEYITLERINTKRKMGGDTIRGDDCFEIWKWLINEQQ